MPYGDPWQSMQARLQSGCTDLVLILLHGRAKQTQLSSGHFASISMNTGGLCLTARGTCMRWNRQTRPRQALAKVQIRQRGVRVWHGVRRGVPSGAAGGRRAARGSGRGRGGDPPPQPSAAPAGGAARGPCRSWCSRRSGAAARRGTGNGTSWPGHASRAADWHRKWPVHPAAYTYTLAPDHAAFARRPQQAGASFLSTQGFGNIQAILFQSCLPPAYSTMMQAADVSLEGCERLSRLCRYRYNLSWKSIS